MQNEIVISNPGRLNDLKGVMKKDGPSRLHILADFDRTITTAFVDGKRVPSLISILRDGNYLTPDYSEKAHVLADKYRLIEDDRTIPFKERWVAMDAWWREHSKLLIASGLKKRDIEKAVTSGKVRLRDGFAEFVDRLRAHGVPLVIMSASGLGVDGVNLYLKHTGNLHDNVHTISNVYEWNEEGQAIALHEPIIHTLNKYEIAIQDHPAFDVIEKRKNVILLGDSVDDVGMVQGFKYDNLITVGFLNDNMEKNLGDYKKAFDVVITGDGSMAYVNELLNDVIRR